MTVRRTDNNATQNIGFLSNGMLDEGSLFGFGSGVTLRIPLWNDQGGYGFGGGTTQDATQTTVAFQPTITGTRRIGKNLSVMFDGYFVSSTTSPSITFLNLPAAQTFQYYNAAVAGSFGVASIQNQTSVVNISANATYAGVGLDWQTKTNVGLLINNGRNTGITPLNSFREGANVAVQNESGAASTFMLNGITTTLAQGGANGSAAGGTLGGGTSLNSSMACSTSGCFSGLVDESAIIIEPRTLTVAETRAIEASLSYWNNVPTQARGVNVILGDSLTQEYGPTFQQSWPRQMEAILNRPDIPVVNGALYGVQMSVLLANWNALYAPSLSSSYGPNRYVTMMGCFNDMKTGGITSSACMAFYQQASTLTRAAGAKFICGITPVSSAQPANLVAMGQLIRAAAPTMCDGVIDMQTWPDFNMPGVTNSATLPEFYTDGTHQLTYGASVKAQIGAAAMRQIIGNN